MQIDWKQLQELLPLIDKLGGIYARSGALNCTRVEQGQFIAAMCIQDNMSIGEWLTIYDLVNSVPRKKALACLADFRKRGGTVRWIADGTDGIKAIGKFTLDGQSIEVTYTMDEARSQNLVRKDSAWMKWPANMLRARVITQAIGMLAPEIVAGTADYSETPETTGPTLNLADTSQSINQTPKPPEPEKSELLHVEKPTLKPVFEGSIPTLEPEDDIPMEFPSSIEPETTKAKPETQELDPETIKALGDILSGHYVEAARFLLDKGWIGPAPVKPINTELQASAYLKKALPSLSPSRAKEILEKKLTFL